MTPTPPNASSEQKRTVPNAMRAWWFFHAVIVLLWTFPQAPPAVRMGVTKGDLGDQLLYANDQLVRVSPLKYYLMSTGFWQYWDMFAPDPLATDYYLVGDVEFVDGTRKEGYYPRLAAMPIPERYISERYRKYLERAGNRNNRFLWSPMAQQIAKVAERVEGKPVRSVTLVKYLRRTPPPGNPLLPFGRAPYHTEFITQGEVKP